MILTLLLLSVLSVSLAQVATSSNYTLQSDSINVGGGLSSSTNFTQESTVGEIATGLSSSTQYQLRAGYQQMQEVFISLTPPQNVVMTPELPGITGGTSNGSTTLAVVTDSPSGYQVTLESANSPAMQNGVYSIADYDEGAEPDYSFTFSNTQALFGYNPVGVDVAEPFLTDGVGLCDVFGGSSIADNCWAGLDVTPKVVVQSMGSNHPAGATTTLFFRVGIGSSAGVIAGTYVATSTITALPL